MFVRDALENDIDGLWECAKAFEAYADYKKQGLPFDEKSFRDMVRRYINDENGIVINLMDGLKVAGSIAGMVYPWPFNNSMKICMELYYWVHEQYRGIKSVRLLAELEKQAGELGASKIFMITVNTNLADKVEKLYLNRGYEKNEQQYVKSI